MSKQDVFFILDASWIAVLWSAFVIALLTPSIRKRRVDVLRLFGGCAMFFSAGMFFDDGRTGEASVAAVVSIAMFWWGDRLKKRAANSTPGTK